MDKKPSIYNHQEIEKKWQEKWEGDGLYTVSDSVSGKENYYTLVEFPYPSGNLHVGHWYAFGVQDIFARYKRMQGFNVLFPIGFDAFGLPAENAAIKLGADPKVWTYGHMEKMRGQMRSIGTMFDWSREAITCDPAYYKWTQWMFNQFYKNDLAYRANTKVNWCPNDKTVLANEQVIDGKCDRCGAEVVQKDQDQWMLRITKYADRLIDDLDTLDWPNAIKESQKSWIGRSEGSEITFTLSTGDTFAVFTTRADTLFGVTYAVLAPEHPLLQTLKPQIKNWDEVEAYISATQKKSELDRQQSKDKTGVKLNGVTATNPANGENIPVWIADYVLAGYGTGAVMAVPAHDERDFEFAKKYHLPIKQVVGRETGEKRENEQFRDGGCGIVFDPETQKYAVAKWHSSYIAKGRKQSISLFAGGVEEGEDMQEGVTREVVEESGLYDFKHIEQIERAFAHYFNAAKQVNRFAPATCFLYILNSQAQKGQHLEGHENFEVVWMDAAEVINAWSAYNQDGTYNHYIRFMTEATARAIELGYDTTSDKKIFKRTAMTEDGILVYSGEFTNTPSSEARKKITAAVGGKLISTYRLRDWGISRQRYWGVPIPIVYDPEGKAHAIPDEYLPWLLPTDVDYTPDGTAPLARSKELLERTEKIFGAGWKPEVETMDTFVDSSWYFYRYLDNKNDQKFASAEKMNAWMPVDLYMGGAEHTTMHLLYSRFWVKALYDLGFVKDPEAYTVRRNRGLILGPDGNKMSKSKGNVIDPDDIVNRLGADTVRMYLAFMGPYGVTANYPWDPNGVVGIRRFLERVWKLSEKLGSNTNVGMLHKTIKGITQDMEEFKFNTAISKMMILCNGWEKESVIDTNQYKTFLTMLSAFAPHMTEELWHTLGETSSIHLASWPMYDESFIVEEAFTLGVQINGKVRTEIVIAQTEDELSVKEKVLALPEVIKWLEGKEPKKFIYIPGKIISIVV